MKCQPKQDTPLAWSAEGDVYFRLENSDEPLRAEDAGALVRAILKVIGKEGYCHAGEPLAAG